MELDYLKMQERNPLGLCAFIPIDIRKIELIKDKNQIIFKKRENKLDLPHFFKSSCPYCISMFVSLKYQKYIPHFSVKHINIPLIKNIDAYVIYYGKIIEKTFEYSKTIRSGLFLDDPVFEKESEQVEEFIEEKEEIDILKPVELLTHISSVKNNNNDMIKNLIISPHPKDNKFSKGMFHKFHIDIRNEDGYVRAYSIRENANSLSEKEKLVDMWQKNRKVQETIFAYSKILNLPFEKLVIKILDVDAKLKGIYLHPKLIVEYASWISVDFKIYTQDIIMEFFSKDAEKKLNDEILRLRIENGEKTSKIDVLINDVNGLKNEVGSLKNEIVLLKTEVKSTKLTVEDAFGYIENRMNRMTVTVSEHLTHVFVICEIITDDPYKKIQFRNTYVIIRCQLCEKDNMISKKETKYGVKLNIIFDIKHANPIELVNKIANTINLKRNHSKFKVLMDESEFIYEVKKIIVEDVYEYLIIKDKYQK